MLQEGVQDELGHEVAAVEPRTPDPDRLPGKARTLQDQGTRPVGPEPALVGLVEPDLGLCPVIDAQLESGQHLEGQRLARLHLEGVVVQFSLLLDGPVDDGREAQFLGLRGSMVRRFLFVLERLIHEMQAQGVGEACGTHEAEVMQSGTSVGGGQHFQHGQKFRLLPVLSQKGQCPLPVVLVFVQFPRLRDLLHRQDPGLNIVTFEPDGVGTWKALSPHPDLERSAYGPAQRVVGTQLGVRGLGLVIGMSALKAPHGEPENAPSQMAFQLHGFETLPRVQLWARLYPEPAPPFHRSSGSGSSGSNGLKPPIRSKEGTHEGCPYRI